MVEEEEKDKEEEQPLTLLDLPRSVRQTIWKNAMIEQRSNDGSWDFSINGIRTSMDIGLVSWVELNASVCGCFLFSPLPSRLISPSYLKHKHRPAKSFMMISITAQRVRLLGPIKSS